MKKVKNIDGLAALLIISIIVYPTFSMVNESIGLYEPISLAIFSSTITGVILLAYLKFKKELIGGLGLVYISLLISTLLVLNEGELTYLIMLLFMPLAPILLLQNKTNIKVFLSICFGLYIIGVGFSWKFFNNPPILIFAPFLAYIIILYARFRELKNQSILKEQKEKLEEYNIQLQQSNDHLEQFNYVASHDLKTPLRGIHHYSQFLLEDYGESIPEEGRSMIESIQKLSQKMYNLISDLLSFSRSQKVDLSIAPVDLNNLIDQIKNELEIQPDVDVLISHQNLPTCEVDATLFKEVLFNFIINAHKYNNSKRKEVNISYNSDTKELYISDNGIGIEKENFSKIFQFFKRLNSDDEYGYGTGAGLAIVQKILERHNISVYLTSELNKGTTFILNLNKVVTL